MININIADIIVKNKTNYTMQISKKLHLRILQEIDYENVFFAIEMPLAKPKMHSKSSN